MAIISSGFDGSIDDVQFAKLMTLAGVRYAVPGTSDFAVKPVGGARSVSVAAGQAYGVGVLAISDATSTVPLSTPTSGQWFLIVIRRDWVANSSTLVAVAGATTSTATPSAPPTAFPAMQSTPGLKDDQPLGWAWANNTSTVVTVFDLRTLPVSMLLTSINAAIDTLRTQVGQLPTSINWANVDDRPTTFPPTSHTLDSHSGELSVSNGGTGSTTASAARTALGVPSTTDVNAIFASVTTALNGKQAKGPTVFVQPGQPSGATNDLWFW